MDGLHFRTEWIDAIAKVAASLKKVEGSTEAQPKQPSKEGATVAKQGIKVCMCVCMYYVSGFHRGGGPEISHPKAKSPLLTIANLFA